MQEQSHTNGFAYQFYKSAEWKHCRSAYLRRQPLCERCGLPAQQVHHKIKLTPSNLQNPFVTLNPDNLEALCEKCHHLEHKQITKWRCDSLGHVEL